MKLLNLHIDTTCNKSDQYNAECRLLQDIVKLLIVVSVIRCTLTWRNNIDLKITFSGRYYYNI